MSDPLFQEVRELINSQDPEDLLDIAPVDEYDPEVRELVALVRGHEKITGAVVAEVWLRFFGASDWPIEHPSSIDAVAFDLEAIRRRLRGER